MDDTIPLFKFCPAPPHPHIEQAKYDFKQFPVEGMPVRLVRALDTESPKAYAQWLFRMDVQLLEKPSPAYVGWTQPISQETPDPMLMLDALFRLGAHCERKRKENAPL